MSAQPGTVGPPIFFPEEDKVAHVALYAIFGVTLAWAARGRRTGSGAWVPPGIGLLFAVSDEWHQTFVPMRDASMGDLAADTLGLLLGYWLTSLYMSRHTERGVTPFPRTDPGPQPE